MEPVTCGDTITALRPADVCRALLAALDASEGRRQKRKRDQTPDAFGLAVKRDLLRRAVEVIVPVQMLPEVEPGA